MRSFFELKFWQILRSQVLVFFRQQNRKYWTENIVLGYIQFITNWYLLWYTAPFLPKCSKTRYIYSPVRLYISTPWVTCTPSSRLGTLRIINHMTIYFSYKQGAGAIMVGRSRSSRSPRTSTPRSRSRSPLLLSRQVTMATWTLQIAPRIDLVFHTRMVWKQLALCSSQSLLSQYFLQ